MDTSSHRRRNRRTRRLAETTPPAATARGDQAVSDAEDIVADAWVQILIGHRDQTLSAARGAAARCDTARRNLSAALLARAPGAIALAQASLEAALAGHRTDVRNHEQAQRGLAAELDLLAWRSIQRTVEACIAGTAGTPTPTGRLRAHDAPALLPARLSRRFVPWMLSIAARFTAGGPLS